jgi:hypothetical protein
MKPSTSKRNHRPDDGVDDCREDTAHENKSDLRQQPTGNDSTSNAHHDVAYESKAVALDEHARQPGKASGRIVPLSARPPCCPLIADDSSPWTGAYDAGSCSWWTMTCSTSGIPVLVEEAAELGGQPFMPILGPNQPRRQVVGEARHDDYPIFRKPPNTAGRNYWAGRSPPCRWQSAYFGPPCRDGGVAHRHALGHLIQINVLTTTPCGLARGARHIGRALCVR